MDAGSGGTGTLNVVRRPPVSSLKPQRGGPCSVMVCLGLDSFSWVVDLLSFPSCFPESVSTPVTSVILQFRLFPPGTGQVSPVGFQRCTEEPWSLNPYSGDLKRFDQEWCTRSETYVPDTKGSPSPMS